MTTRICKKVQYIPKTGNPVFEIFEELEEGGRVVSLDPRNPTAEELQDADEKFAAAQQARIADLESQLSAMTAERDSLTTEKAALTTERDSLQSQVTELEAELEAIKNPPNPFPNADWQGFRSAALASPTIMRMAMSNMGNFMMLLIYMTEMQKDPTATTKMVGVWNEMETKTPISADEITAINQLAAQYQVPMVLNSEGQIVL